MHVLIIFLLVQSSPIIEKLGLAIFTQILFIYFQTSLPWAECPTEIIGNISVPVAECAKSSETSYFWYRETLGIRKLILEIEKKIQQYFFILDISESISDFDGIRGPMLLCLALAWIIVYLIIMKGIKSSGYVVYFTAGFPYVVMTIFFIRGITLPGATEGLMHMFNPDVSCAFLYIFKFLFIRMYLNPKLIPFVKSGTYGSIFGQDSICKSFIAQMSAHYTSSVSVYKKQ